MIVSSLLAFSQVAVAGAIVRNGAMLNLYDRSIIETSLHFAPDDNPLIPGRMGGYALDWRMWPWQAVVLESHISGMIGGPFDLSVGGGMARRAPSLAGASSFIGHASVGIGMSAWSSERIEGSAWYATLGGAFAIPTDHPAEFNPAIGMLLSFEGAIDRESDWRPEPVVMDVSVRSAPIALPRRNGGSIPICRVGAGVAVTPLNDFAELSASVVVDLGPLELGELKVR